MKFCSRCETEKEFEDFRKNKSKRDGLSAWCKICFREYERKYYKDNEDRRSQIKSRRDKKRSEARQFVWQFLLKHPCVICGEDDPVVLEFDHMEPSKKSLEISNMVSRARSLKSLKQEISKCQVLCANCHRRKTSKQFSWYNSPVV